MPCPDSLGGSSDVWTHLLTRICVRLHDSHSAMFCISMSGCDSQPSRPCSMVNKDGMSKGVALFAAMMCEGCYICHGTCCWLMLSVKLVSEFAWGK